MLFTLSTTQQPATDLGYLLHKNPSRIQTVSFGFGQATVLYPEASDEQCTIAVLLEVDAVSLVRGSADAVTGLFDHYVTDRPYALSSFMSVAIAKLFSTAMSGRSKDRQTLAEQALPLTLTLTPLPCRGGEALLRRLFEPLGYAMQIERHPLDAQFDWGESRYYSVQLTVEAQLGQVLRHIYVLLPVLDASKHYWVDEAEIEKLLSKGEGWLAEHPEKKLISMRYMKNRKSLANAALLQLQAGHDIPDAARDDAAQRAEQQIEKPLRLNDIRMQTVVDTLQASGASSVLDLGCGEGRLLGLLRKVPQFTRIAGVDISSVALARAYKRLHMEQMSERQAERLQLWHGALTYADERCKGFDAAALVEVIEHVDEDRLPSIVQAVFGYAQPNTVIVTTPNQEYNVLFESLPAGDSRHHDHRFEWTRAEFEAWSAQVADQYGYQVQFYTIGDVHEVHGAPTQMGVFTQCQ